MDNLRKKRGVNTTDEQKRLLIEFIEKHEQLLSGKFNENFKYSDAKNLWVELSQILNSCNGAYKTWKEWRKTWQDLRSRAKNKKSEANKNLNKTGGGEYSKLIFTDCEEKILQIVGKTSLEGHQKSNESYVHLIQNENTFDTDDIILHDPNLSKTATSIQTDEIVETETPFVTHDYTKSRNHKEVKVVDTPNEMSETIAKTPSRPQNIQNDRAKNRRRVASERLENSLKATNNLANISEKTYNLKAKYYERKLELKKNYYEEKLELMKRDVMSKENIANCLHTIANHLQHNNN